MMAGGTNIYGGGGGAPNGKRSPLGNKPSKNATVRRDDSDDTLVTRYFLEIERYNKTAREWAEEGEQIENVYLDEGRSEQSRRRFAMLWTNVEVLKPAVYGKMPTVLCSRRYKDPNPTARIAAEIMERAVNTSFDLYRVDNVFKAVRDDRLLPGRGQAWVRYEAKIETIYEKTSETDSGTGTAGKRVGSKNKMNSISRDRVVGEKVCVDYVRWTDFGHNVARTWDDVWLVWRCVYMTQEEVSKRFGSDAAENIGYTAKPPAANITSNSGLNYLTNDDDRAKIYEIWDKKEGAVTWLADGENSVLESGDPPISFMNFFPCPEPAFATKTSKSLIPRPDYVYYRDQAKEINDLTDKIHQMMQWLIVKAFVPGGPSTIADPLEEIIRDTGNDALFVQVDSWKEWLDKGGAGKTLDWFPTEKIVAVITAAVAARNQLIQDVFQLTGISDILRGQSDPVETLGAQELKAQTGGRRLRSTRDELSRIVRDVAYLVAEVIAERFNPRTLAEITGFAYVPPPRPMPALQPPMGFPLLTGPPLGAPLPPGPPPGMVPPPAAPAMPPGLPLPPPAAAPPGLPSPMGGPMPGGVEAETGLTFGDDVIALLRNDRMRSFQIDIETDQTAAADENAEKERRTEVLGVAGTYLEKAGQMVSMAPALAPAIKELLMFAIRSFRAGRGLEEALEKGFTQFAAQAQQAMTAAQGSQGGSGGGGAEAAAAAQAQQKMVHSKQEHEQAMAAAAQKHQFEMDMLNRKAQIQEQEHRMRIEETGRQQAATAQKMVTT